MSSDVCERLNKKFALNQQAQQVSFTAGRGGLPVVEIENRLATATIALQGAHLLAWQPKGHEPVIWLSEEANFAQGKSVRGGIPVCWPWFGAHDSQAAFPAHGFARTRFWQVSGVDAMQSGETKITFTLDTRELDEDCRAMWPHPLRAEYTMTIGTSLILTLTSCNEHTQPITIGQALHTYFNVSDVRKTKVYGLEDKDYLDKTEGFARHTQQGAVTFDREVDRIYLDTPDDVVIDNGARRICIAKTGSRSTVVWNPWSEVANKMGDLGKDGYLQMLCVESANAADDVVTIAAGATHTLEAVYTPE